MPIVTYDPILGIKITWVDGPYIRIPVRRARPRPPTPRRHA